MNETRAKAGAILSARKMRELEAEGITVVTKERLEALERLALAAIRWRAGMIDRVGFVLSPSDRQVRARENRESTFGLRNAVDALGEMEK